MTAEWSTDDMPEEALFLISFVAEATGLHPQTLRQYDRLGLVSPSRARGRGRRYTERDVHNLRRVQQLTADGVNLAGVKRILELETQLEQAQQLLAALTGRPGSFGSQAETYERESYEPENPYLPVLRSSTTTAVVRWWGRQ